MNLAVDERVAICAAFDRTGPDRPTLCAGWNTRDLLAHLLVRERQPWATPGIIVPSLAPLAEHATRRYDDTPWPELVDLLRGGAPVWSPYRIGAVDQLANSAELFVHHEDVRRGEPGWAPRPSDPVRDEELWSLLQRMGRMLYRHSPSGIVLRRPSGVSHAVRTGPGPVTLVGEPAELVLHAFGRDAVQVEVEGEPADVDAFTGAARGI